MKFLITILLSSLCQVNLQILCDFRDTVNITGGQKDGDNFIFNNDTYSFGYYGEFDYIFQNYDEIIKVDLHIRGCVCHIKPCIRICCNEYREPIDRFCTKTNQLEFDNGETIDLKGEKYGVLIGRSCQSMFMLIEEDEWTFHDGKIHTPLTNFVDTSGYCFAQNENNQTLALMCWDNVEDFNYLYSIAMMISVPFLLVTIFIFSSNSKLKTLHGKCLICLCAALLIFYLFKSILNFYFNVSHEICITLGYLLYLFSLVPIIWMNVICIDIFFLTKNGIRTEKKEQQLFKYYTIYGFGLPFLMTFLIITIDLFELLPQEYMPMIGLERCWIQSNVLVEIIYLRLPISIVFIANIILFLLTSYKVFKAQRTICNDANKAVISRFFIYLKLFFITGISWSMEIFSWIYYYDYQTFFLICDLFNCLLGVFIFLVCVLNKPTLKILKTSFNCKNSKNTNDSSYANGHTTKFSVDQ
ncbi:hypothetical protein PVAND_009237 [Polypedilum vanderplanki]|uniref:G-protein coupled receptors family 2 profile 2 domain-containing protein n=1 Tax=Polypedilum vanderplanki TaxID=319348 RepID=A0A9J6CC33_POLVA|nr:hypothetical protein PVAND_009237 [Polypedilum vanderplanki]